jgi:hypothetical protein
MSPVVPPTPGFSPDRVPRSHEGPELGPDEGPDQRILGLTCEEEKPSRPRSMGRFDGRSTEVVGVERRFRRVVGTWPKSRQECFGRAQVSRREIETYSHTLC